ncbi:MAG: LytTR family transcriptional regulator [Bacteroidales bacterium]|nr:LytTR family transcriptional regulator [Bacteroidales bacterium]
MSKAINKIISGAGTIMHSLVIPFFVLIFIIYYKPYVAYQILSMDNASFPFNATILFSIVLVTLSITRGWLYLVGKYRELSSTNYLMWSLAETLIASLFCSLYLVLMSDELSFFETAGKAFINMLAMVVYPYGFLWLGFELYTRKDDEPAQVDDNTLIRFYDEYKKLRLVIATEAVMFIKSEDNYVQIHYLDRSRTRKFILRSSMRALEEDLARHGLVRCHRSYFINPSFIKIVHRDSSGLIVAELSQDGFESIPISRKYQDEISRLL